MNRKNLKKLADYLLKLPENYKGFDMGVYFHDSSTDDYIASQADHAKHTCNTVGCAIGHGPAIKGMKAHKHEYWHDYVLRVCGFDEESIEYNWCFEMEWERFDNTPKGAAIRIQMLLDSGVPKEFSEDFDYNPSIYSNTN
jgi:hypothetical protein